MKKYALYLLRAEVLMVVIICIQLYMVFSLGDKKLFGEIWAISGLPSEEFELTANTLQAHMKLMVSSFEATHLPLSQCTR